MMCKHEWSDEIYFKPYPFKNYICNKCNRISIEYYVNETLSKKEFIESLYNNFKFNINSRLCYPLMEIRNDERLKNKTAYYEKMLDFIPNSLYHYVKFRTWLLTKDHNK